MIKNNCASCGKIIKRGKNPTRYFKENGNYCNSCNVKCEVLSKVRTTLGRIKDGAVIKNTSRRILLDRLEMLNERWGVDLEYIEKSQKNIALIQENL